MPEVRVDPLTGLKTIIAGARADRPGSWLDVAPDAPIDPAGDPFAPGHEDETPPTVYQDGTPWRVRAFANKYPALVAEAQTPERDANPDLYTAQPATGAHEVIVNAPDPVTNLAALDTDQVILAVDAWRERMRAHVDAACRHLIVNERKEAGASLAHTHAQLFALDFVPRPSRASASASALTPCARWAATCSATTCRRRSAGASGSSPSTTRPC